jgi:hypothetical protein
MSFLHFLVYLINQDHFMLLTAQAYVIHYKNY